MHTGKKGADWLNDPKTPPHMAIWISVARPVMHLHFRFFKSAARLGGKDGHGELLALSNHRRSPAVKKLADLWSAMDGTNEMHEIWKLLALTQGGVGNIDEDLMATVHDAMLDIMGNLFRRFIHDFSGWPFRLHELFDDVPAEDRAACQEDLVAAEICCLDQHLSAKVKRDHPSVDALQDPTLQEDLYTLFEKASRLMIYKGCQDLGCRSAQHPVSRMTLRDEYYTASRLRSILSAG